MRGAANRRRASRLLLLGALALGGCAAEQNEPPARSFDGSFADLREIKPDLRSNGDLSAAMDASAGDLLVPDLLPPPDLVPPTCRQFGAPPSIFMVLPTSGQRFVPVVVTGSNFSAGAVPYFGGIPATPLFNCSLRNIPNIGSFMNCTTIVPPGPVGPAALKIECNGLFSAEVAFTRN